MPTFPVQGTDDLQVLRFRLRPNFWPVQGIATGDTVFPDMLFSDNVEIEFSDNVVMEFSG